MSSSDEASVAPRVSPKVFADVPSARELAAARGRAGTFMLLSGVLFVALIGGGAFGWNRDSALQQEKAAVAAQLASVQAQYQTAESQRQALSGFAEVAGLQGEVAALRADIQAKVNDPSTAYLRNRVRNLWVNYDTPPELWIAEQKAQLQAQIAGLQSLRDVLNSAIPAPSLGVADKPQPAAVAPAAATPTETPPPAPPQQ